MSDNEVTDEERASDIRRLAFQLNQAVNCAIKDGLTVKITAEELLVNDFQLESALWDIHVDISRPL